MEAFEVVGAAVYDASTDELLPAVVTLMERSNGGIDVALVLDRSRVERVLVSVTVAGETVTVPVPEGEALDAYWHPFSGYVAPFGGITREAPPITEAEMQALADESWRQPSC